MSTLLSLNDVLMVRLQMTDFSGNKAFNVLHYQLKDVNNGPWTPTPMYDIAGLIAEEFFDWFGPAFGLTASNMVSMNAVSVQSMWPAPKSRMYTFTDTTQAGQGVIVSEPLPMQDAVTILKRGAAGNRSNLGRAFIPGIPENGQNAGVIGGAQRALYDIYKDAFDQVVSVLVGAVTLNFYPVLFHLNPAGQANIVDIMDAEVSDNIIKTQRRRRPGKGI